ncbi:unnamed protein product [Diabrotica balteata]|uniref:Cytochrome P450 n=1 Tax=Diabrotica balteata TaxID=107213 RepID=A0A9N9X576_DIABA|nr:unnamed protein product [Diabrotica balteata]
MLNLIIGVAIILVLIYFLGIKPFNYWKKRGVIQGNPALFLGDSWEQMMKKQTFAEMVQKVYSFGPGARYAGMYQFMTPILVVKDLELLKQLFVKDFDHFTDHGKFVSEEADPLWAKNLFFLTGQKWRDMRAILSPAFTSKKMKSMFFLISETADDFVNHFLEQNKDSIELELKDKFTRFTNDIIASIAFGVKIDSLKNPNNEFFLMGQDITSFSGFKKTMKFMGIVMVPKFFTFFKIGFFATYVRKFFINLIGDTVKAREEKNIVRPDMLHLLIQARKGGLENGEKSRDGEIEAAEAESNELIKKVAKDMTMVDIAAQALIFFFAGFDSVASLLSFTCYELMVNPDIQTRLRKEIEETLEQCNGNVTYEAIMKMKYMDMVLSETGRKWPQGTMADRVCTKPYTIPAERPDEVPVHLDVGAALWIPIYAIHRDPENFPEPERYDPERFNEENKSKIKPYSFIPFGVGPRNCIGARFALLETKIVLFKFLSHFELVPSEKTKIPVEISKKQFNLTAEGGFWFNLKRIKK